MDDTVLNSPRVPGGQVVIPQGSGLSHGRVEGVTGILKFHALCFLVCGCSARVFCFFSFLGGQKASDGTVLVVPVSVSLVLSSDQVASLSDGS